MGDRKLENWLDTYIEWVKPRSESPESMILWSGLFTLSAVMRRRVKWPRDLLGGYEVYPNIYVILVAEPGVARKSTTVGFSEDILRAGSLRGPDTIRFSGDITSHSKLLDAMDKSHDSSVAIVSKEFSSLIQTTPESMYEVLIDLYDNKKNLDWSTWEHDDVSIENPTINLFAATTPAWISSQPPEYFVEGGFASRVIFIHEDEPRQREIYYDHLDLRESKEQFRALAHDLNEIAAVSGDFRHDLSKTKEYIRGWYKRQKISIDDPRIKGFYSRKHTHAHKVSMLLSLAERSDKVVTREHWDRAVEILDYVEKRLPRAFANLGFSSTALLMEKIQVYIEKKGKVKLGEIAARFYTEGLTLDQLKATLKFMEEAGKVERKGQISPTYESVGRD